MANKRQLKRGINTLCNELLAETVAITLCGKTFAQEDIDKILVNILKLQDDMLNRVSHPEPGLPQKAYFKNLQTDMATGVESIAEQIKALL